MANSVATPARKVRLDSMIFFMGLVPTMSSIVPQGLPEKLPSGSGLTRQSS
jgi:hypothetical protein